METPVNTKWIPFKGKRYLVDMTDKDISHGAIAMRFNMLLVPKEVIEWVDEEPPAEEMNCRKVIAIIE